jgi:hypothetical protein
MSIFDPIPPPNPRCKIPFVETFPDYVNDELEGYIKCLLRKGNKQMVRWLLATEVFLGKIVRVKNIEGYWEDGWEIVIPVYGD